MRRLAFVALSLGLCVAGNSAGAQQSVAVSGPVQEELSRRLAAKGNDAEAAYGLGEAAAERKDYQQAAQFLRRALEAQPGMRAARLRLAQVLSFEHEYEDAVAEYDRLLKDDPGDLEALLESARVSGWGRRYPEAAARYRRYLAVRDEPAARFQLAQVYAWGQQYEEALRELDALLRTTPEARDVLLERGRVLAFLRRYSEAIAQLDQALARFSDDPELLYAMGQALYWSGNLPEADRLLSAAHRRAPENADALFALASVARARGDTRRALRLIPPDTRHPESKDLRASLLQDLRPELRLLFSGEHATEFISDRPINPGVGLRSYRGNARLSFWLTPELRAQADFNSIPSFADHGSFLGALGDSFLSNNLMVAVSGRISPNVRWTLGGGGNAQTSQREHWLYSAALRLPALPHSTLELEANRTMVDYTPRAVALHVSAREYRAQWDTLAGSFLRLNLTVLRDNYSTGNHSNSGQGSVEVQVPSTESGTVAIGYSYQVLSFTRSFNAGFFTPRLYQKHWATGRYSGRVRQMLRYDLHGSLGPQQAAFFGSRAEPQEFTLSGSAGVLVEWSLTGNNLFGAGYDFARTALTTGAYRSHSFQIFWQGRF